MMTTGKADPTVPDPGPEPQSENLTPVQIVEKYGADLADDVVWADIKKEMIADRKLTTAADRKSKAEHAAFDAWSSAYVRRYGTDEG